MSQQNKETIEILEKALDILTYDDKSEDEKIVNCTEYLREQINKLYNPSF